ncbi:L-fucono-1,5-lactonase-like [Montipora foliosa]|uniref:L-fucono-1,5-lactonase-like n=1 Tax=Montipora foliosa TaxID=591990 RepID=UPI0035F1D0A6
MDAFHGKEIVDAHVHLWDCDKYFYPWPTDLKAIYRPFLIGDLQVAIEPSPVRKVVFIQVNQTYDETDWILEQYPAHTSTIVGIIGWVDLTDPKVNVILEKYMEYKVFRGVRNILEGEPDDWLGRESVQRGLGYLEEKGLTYDLLIRTRHFKLAETVVKKFPKLKFVIDHAAKPEIKDGKIDEWKKGMEMLAQNPNVFCKISGLVTEASRENWKVDDLIPYVKHVIAVFGADRCMFGSDWPVCTLAKDASYKNTFEAYLECVSHLSESEKKAVFCENVVKFYGLEIDSEK